MRQYRRPWINVEKQGLAFNFSMGGRTFIKFKVSR